MNWDAIGAVEEILGAAAVVPFCDLDSPEKRARSSNC